MVRRGASAGMGPPGWVRWGASAGVGPPGWVYRGGSTGVRPPGWVHRGSNTLSPQVDEDGGTRHVWLGFARYKERNMSPSTSMIVRLCLNGLRSYSLAH